MASDVLNANIEEIRALRKFLGDGSTTDWSSNAAILNTGKQLKDLAVTSGSLGSIEATTAFNFATTGILTVQNVTGMVLTFVVPPSGKFGCSFALPSVNITGTGSPQVLLGVKLTVNGVTSSRMLAQTSSSALTALGADVEYPSWGTAASFTPGWAVTAQLAYVTSGATITGGSIAVDTLFTGQVPHFRAFVL